MHLTALTPAIGVEIRGLDLSRELSDEAVGRLRAVWLEHLVVFIKGQELTPAQQLAFARRLGVPDHYPFLTGLTGYPEITEVLKREDETINFGGLWHTDTTYQTCPPMATMLYAKELPAAGGDTLFANQYLAWETLSAGLRQTLSSVQAIASAGKQAVAATRVPRMAEQGTGRQPDQLQAVHPVARRHPETGRTSLFINPAHTVGFKNWTQAESEPLLNYLFAWQTREALCCRFRWEPGDLALWDNRCTLHFPINDYPGHRRLMHRITLRGDAVEGAH